MGYFGILTDISEHVNLVKLMDFLGNVNHAISVLGYWIFDSKYLLLFAWPPARTV